MSQIITVPSPVLRTPAKPVEALDKRVLDIINNMTKVLKEAKRPQGVGLAAPQIGVSLRIFLIRPNPKDPITTFINPEIIKYSQHQTNPASKHGIYEGCLSLPSHYAPLTRSMAVTVKYQTLKTSPLTPLLNSGEGNARGEVVEKTQVFTGFAAHVIQHEMDHLNGILFIDRVLEQGSKLYRVVESLPAGRQEWEEVGI